MCHALCQVMRRGLYKGNENGVSALKTSTGQGCNPSSAMACLVSHPIALPGQEAVIMVMAG